MSKQQYLAIRDRINLTLCNTCYKPIVDDNFYIVLGHRRLKKYIYHSTAQACANAEPLKKDWYRQNDRTKTHQRAKAGLQDSNGHSGNTDDDMSVWFDDLELEGDV